MKIFSSLNEPQLRLIAELSTQALNQNYDCISERVPNQFLMPIIKANAYGHGAEWVARALLHKRSLFGFGVATLTEAKQLRLELSERGRKTRILVLSGATPWSEEMGHFCEKYFLTPTLTSYEDWEKFLKEKWPARISYELKFNTGMNRLGIHFSKAMKIAKFLGKKPVLWHPSGVFSHCALGEAPEHPLSFLQRERFKAVRSEFSSCFASTRFHLGNSAAIWLAKKWGLDDLTDIVRPGLALYGIPPWRGAPAFGLEPVLSLKARVIAIHSLQAGEKVGYGGGYRVDPRKENGPIKVAILCAGYADGIHRLLSNSGKVYLNGSLMPFLGPVSMDLCAIRCPKGTRIGDWAILMGSEIDPWQQAKEARTIPYELLTSVSTRVKRVYG